MIERSEDQKASAGWGGIALPLVAYNSTDGLGLGLGGEVFFRKPNSPNNYDFKFTGSTYWTTTLNYTSSWAQIERNGPTRVFARVTYRYWRSLLYVGAGGDNAVLLDDDDARGNGARGPSAMVATSRSLGSSGWSLWGQAMGRFTLVDPNPGGRLDRERPFGVDGGFTFDASLGVAYDRYDRWPRPTRGVRAEASMRWGGTTQGADFEPLTGVHAEVAGWVPLLGSRLVLGGRSVVDKTYGSRPFFEQDILGGRYRDELGLEQILTGYGRTRTRGDGVMATSVELTGLVYRTPHAWWDLAMYWSVFAESGFLFEGDRLGPHLPTVGGGPNFVWQRAVQLRPFLSAGWRSDTPGGKRRAIPQFGLSLVGAL